MAVMTVAEAQSRLAEIIEQLVPGDEVVLTVDGQPLAKLVKTGPTGWPCKAGSARGKILYIAPDFDAPLDEFKEYME